MQCTWWQLFCLCAVVQFQLIIGRPERNATSAGRSDQSTNRHQEENSKHVQGETEANTDPTVISTTSVQTSRAVSLVNQPGGKNKEPQPAKHICRVSTDHYDCQFRNVHLKREHPNNVFGLEQNPEQKLTFQDSTLEYLPKSLIDSFPNVTLLNLNELYIGSIEAQAFQHAVNLQTVYLEENRLKNIEQGSFSGAKNLLVLVLSNNEISHFDDNSFDHNTQLRHFYLDRNQLTTLPAFTNIPYLEFLNVSHNNLASIDDRHFSTLSSLRTLDLSFNQLKRLDLQQLEAMINLVDVSFNDLTDFVMPPNVIQLRAKNNSLTEFAVSRSCNLQNLTLARNKIIQAPILKNCNSLYYLDLSYNILEEFILPKHMFKLEQLRLAHNNLFDISMPPKKDLTSFSLRFLDLSHNRLSYGPTLSPLTKLRRVFLNDNHLLTLRSYVDQSHTDFVHYRMANNEWSCDEIVKFHNKTDDKGKELCTENMQERDGICCRTYKKPYNDRLNQILREADFHERSNQKKCPKPESSTRSQMDVLDNIRKAMRKSSAGKTKILEQLQNAKVSETNLRDQLEKLKKDRDYVSASKRNVGLEIEKQRHKHRVIKEGLITDKQMLDRIIQFVQEKDAFNRGLLSRRQKDTEDSEYLFDQKQEEMNNLKNLIESLKSDFDELKKAEKDLKKEKDLKEKRYNKNAPSIYGG